MSKLFVQKKNDEKIAEAKESKIIDYKKSFWKSKKFLITAGVIIVAFAVIGGSALYMNHFLHEKNNNKDVVDLVITKGETVQAITKDLQDKNLIERGLPFLFYLKYKGLSGQLIAGEYQIQTGLTPLQVLDILTSGRVASKKITIPEGWTISDIGDYLQKSKVVTKDEFIAATRKEYNYDFLSNKPASVGLEGYLFPDTYQVSLKASAEDIVNKMLTNFDNKLTSALKAEVAGSGMNLHQVLTLASIVEREASKPEDRKVVAGIFSARLKDDMPLQSDVTVLYVLGVKDKILTDADLKVVSPYNTYLNKGLPIGPINNPGIEAIEAVLNPTITEYRYFLAADGKVYYSKTLAEHQEKVIKYLR